MTFFRFKKQDIVNITVQANPFYTVEVNGDQVTGSIFLEKKFLNDDLLNRRFKGFSNAEGGFVEKDGPFTSSVELLDAEQGGDNQQLYESIIELYNFYSLVDSNYTPDFTGSETVRFRIINVPEIYYDRAILTGSFTGSDLDSSGDERIFYDNGRGGLFSGSVSGTLIGNIFYSEGLVVLKGGGFNDEGAGEEFGDASSTNFKWRTKFRGVHNIPTKIFRCRAPAGQVNASTNPSFFVVPTGSQDEFKNEKVVITGALDPYVTTIGFYNENFQLIGVTKISQPVKKEENQDILFKIRLDF